MTSENTRHWNVREKRLSYLSSVSASHSLLLNTFIEMCCHISTFKSCQSETQSPITFEDKCNQVNHISNTAPACFQSASYKTH